MKLTTTVTISDQNKSCQVCAELELNDQTGAEMLSAKTSELLRGLQSGILNGISGKPVLDVTPVSDWPLAQLPNPSSKTRKQRPDAPVSPKQQKYLNDLLRLNGITLAGWCREKNTSEGRITASDCQQWIPELKDRLEKKNLSF